MAGQRARCTNFGNCTKADNGDFIDIPVGGTPVCPICGKPLTPVPGGAHKSPVGLIVFLVIVVALGFVGWHFLSARKAATGGSTSSGSSTSSASSSSTGQTSEPTVNPGDALMYFERSDEQWLRQAASDYNDQHSTGPKIVLDFRGSREGKQDILYGKGQPVIWNPADVYWVDKLNMDWTDPSVGKHTSPAIVDSRTILSTRLVIVASGDRASVLQTAMVQPKYRGRTWSMLYDIATKGWSAVGGQASWGKLKLIQTDPTKSNSGMTTLALMFNEYRKSHPDAMPSSAGFLSFMRGIEGTVDQFPETTSKSLDAFVNGGGRYDMAIAYEQNAVAALDKGQTDIKVIYPDPTVEIDFPAAILSTPWVTDSEKSMASSFIDYLLSSDVQKSALKLGFRPALTDMRSDVDDEMSSGAHGTAGLQLDPPTVVRPVGAKLIDDLLFQWYKIYGAANGDSNSS
jgi:ABC-type Fe3+ transport system substrate-binding protein